MMKAVVMAGGEGSRLRPLTVGRPKPMVPIVNKPVLAHILDLLRHHGITDVVMTLQYMPTAIQDYFGDGSALGMSIAYVVEESPLGTAGGVRNAAAHLDDTFLVISGDALTDFDLKAILDAHRQWGALATLTLYRVPNPLEYGVIVADEQGRIVRFLEKPDWGNVLSDTVNTGIYVLEPEVLEQIPPDEPFDFATQLFPQLLDQGAPLYGYVAQGYWCDVGTIQEYMRANADVLQGKVRLPQPLGAQQRGGVWTGRDVEIAPDAQLFGPVYLGNSVKLKAGVSVHGPAVIRDYTVVDNYSRVEHSVMWRNTYVGEACEIRGAIICRQCSVKSGVVIYEGAVVGDNCVLDENAVIHAGVKLWPNKEVEPGAVVRHSIIWGSQGRRSLFSKYGVTGVVNVDLTPEFAAKLGSALGATLPLGSYVAINRDVHRSSRMLKRALISGLPSAGIHVWDLGTVPIPVARHFVRHEPSTQAGIHVRLSPFDQRVVDIRFIDANGLNQSPAQERAIERIFFREDFRRAYLDEIGRINYAREPVERYIQDFLDHVDRAYLEAFDSQLVVDYSHGLAGDTLSTILNQLRVDFLPLNGLVDETKLAVLQDTFQSHLRRMAKILHALDVLIGVKLDVGGEKIFVVDEQGQVLDDLVASLLLMELTLRLHPGKVVAMPVVLPRAFDQVAAWHDARILRTRRDLHSLMAASTQPDVVLALDGTGNFIFPDFMPAVDGLMATVRLLEYLAKREMPASQVVAYLPPFYLAEDRVKCPWEIKGAIMRLLNQRFQHQEVETVDGLKIHLSQEEWVYIAPSPDRPFFEISVEAGSTERAIALLNEYVALVKEMVRSQTSSLPELESAFL